MNLNIPLSGMTNAAFRQGVSANNVANLNTPGYRSRSVANADADGGGVRVSEVREDPTPGAPDVLAFSGDTAVEGSNVDLGAEATGNVLITAAYNASAAVFRTESNLLGTVINLKR